ncbi:HesA/MoeB/ThiF family protein [Lentzea sp. NPDC059081]|uniref:HesA/MoeB/ThiF family protein n=1 Tax=Lentzea sp. NPDC059081 TaxID=3346719 RepID=UPI0036C4564F
MDTYDEAAFDRFRAGLVNAGFSPLHGSLKEWSGPLRPSLRPLTTATRMKIVFLEGWPLRYAHVVVEGLRADHAVRGTICLWAVDDPAQVAARELEALWARLDDWAARAVDGFGDQDRALDAHFLFTGERTSLRAELPLGDLVRGMSDGYFTDLTAVTQGSSYLLITRSKPAKSGDNKPRLRGALYLRHGVEAPPRNIDEFRSSLRRRQRNDFDRGRAERTTPASLAVPSGGHDFVVLAWPRHGAHDAVVVGYDDEDGSLRTFALPATANDVDALKRRAGPDAELLASKKVLVTGAGSVGGHVAVALACAGVGKIVLHDSDDLTSANVVRHVGPVYLVGYPKTLVVAEVISSHASWTNVERQGDLSHAPGKLAGQITGADVVVDCTGRFSLTAALAEVCRRTNTALVTGALFHGGRLARVQRQAKGDTLIAARRADPAYLDLPPEDPAEPQAGFLELGCTAPVHNASPIAVLHTASEIARSVVDLLTGRRHLPDEHIFVHEPLLPPFDNVGVLRGPLHQTSKT